MSCRTREREPEAEGGPVVHGPGLGRGQDGGKVIEEARAL